MNEEGEGWEGRGKGGKRWQQRQSSSSTRVLGRYSLIQSALLRSRFLRFCLSNISSYIKAQP